MTDGTVGLRRAASTPGPDFLVIGAARSGTTALCTMLATHPDVRMTSPKEPHFLALHQQARAAFTGPGDAQTINRVAVTDEARWRSLFGPADALRGEGSVSTLYYSSASVAAIQAHCPTVRLIVLLRQPSVRAHSAHMYQTGRGWETESFERALELEPERIASGYHHLWHYRAMGRYGEQLAPFVAAFGRDRLLVLSHDDFERDATATMQRCADHLDLDPTGFSPTTRRINEGAVRARPLIVAERLVRRAPGVATVVKRVLPRTAREAIRGLGSERTTLAPALREQLDASFVDDARELARLLGDDVPGWCRQLL